MVQPKHNPQEALERMKLMMKYDSSKTLTENVEVIKENKKPIDEGVVALAPAAAAMWAWWNYSNKFTNAAQKVKAAFQGCTALLKQSQPSDDVDFTGAADKINTALNVWSGTDEEAVRDAFKMMKTPVDICKLEEEYRNKYSDLYTDLDGDFSGSDWNTYIWSPIYDIMSKVPKEEVKKEEGKKEDGKKEDGGGGVKKVSQYKSCPDTFPINKFCKNSTISKVQGCLGIKADGAFGPGTQAALEAKGLSGTQITQDSVDNACGGSTPFTDLGGSADPDDMA